MNFSDNIPVKLKTFTIEKNDYLSRDIKAYYRTEYLGYNQMGNPDYINTLKNTYNNEHSDKLKIALEELSNNLINELNEIINTFPKGSQVAICVVPRAKNTKFYSSNQLLFRATISCCAGYLKDVINTNIEIIDGVDYIERHTDTRTTHLKRDQKNYDNSGSDPYKGIANDTCHFSDEISGKNIILIDDVYTKTINIDEDFLQALLDRNCKDLVFFAIARTKRKGREAIRGDGMYDATLFAHLLKDDDSNDDIPF